jgi:hypothetical protein
LPRAKPRRVAFFYALLRGLAYPAARAGDGDDLVFYSRHEGVRSAFYFPLSHSICRRLVFQVTSFARPPDTARNFFAHFPILRSTSSFIFHLRAFPASAFTIAGDHDGWV